MLPGNRWKTVENVMMPTLAEPISPEDGYESYLWAGERGRSSVGFVDGPAGTSHGLQAGFDSDSSHRLSCGCQVCATRENVAGVTRSGKERICKSSSIFKSERSPRPKDGAREC